MGRRIAVGFDGSDASIAALAWAGREGELRQATVRVLTSAAPSPATARPQQAASQHTQSQHPTPGPAEDASKHPAVADTVRRHPGVRFEFATVASDPSSMLLGESEGDELIVIGNGRSAPPFADSATAALIGECSCPVVIVPAGPPSSHGTIVVGVDGSEASNRAVCWAGDEADRRASELVVVHAWSYPTPLADARDFLAARGLAEVDAALVLDGALDTLRRRCGVIPDGRLHEGAAPASLLDAARNADLLVVGTHGRSGYRPTTLGTVPYSLLATVTSPLAVIH